MSSLTRKRRLGIGYILYNVYTKREYLSLYYVIYYHILQTYSCRLLLYVVVKLCVKHIFSIPFCVQINIAFLT